MADPPDEILQKLTPHFDQPFDDLSQSAAAGEVVAQREMIQASRDYLLFIANQELPTNIQARCAPSDIVQNTMMRAVDRYSDFRGADQKSLLAWLRQILLNEIKDTLRFANADKRDVAREQSIDDDASTSPIGPLFQSDDLTPSSDAQAREEAARLRKALLALSENYQEVLRLRNWERLKFAEIGRRMDRSEAAVKKLWGRAVEALKAELSHD